MRKVLRSTHNKFLPVNPASGPAAIAPAPATPPAAAPCAADVAAKATTEPTKITPDTAANVAA